MDMTDKNLCSDFNREGYKRLREAVKHNNLDAVKAIIAEGVDVNAHTGNGHTALVDACWSERTLPIVEWLLENGANPDANATHWPPLMCACEGGHGRLGIVKALCAHGADAFVRNERGNTPQSYLWNREGAAVRAVLEQRQAEQVAAYNTRLKSDWESEMKAVEEGVVTLPSRVTVRGPLKFGPKA